MYNKINCYLYFQSFLTQYINFLSQFNFSISCKNIIMTAEIYLIS